MRLHIFDARNFLSKELGVRYIQGLGLEVMLWNWHLQILGKRVVV